LDISSWEFGDLPVERLIELLELQIERQTKEMHQYLEEQDIDSAWEITAIYRALADELLEAARRRSEDWIQPRVEIADKVISLDRPACVALAQELASAPTYLSTEHANKVTELLSAAQCRLTELNEFDCREKVKVWQKKFLELDKIEKLESVETEKLLQELQNPPCELRQDEQGKMDPIKQRLESHYDQMSVDELVRRITNLPKALQKQLLDHLSVLLTK